MIEWEFFVLEKKKEEMQKILNQWKHQFKFKIIWIAYNPMTHVYHCLIKRKELN
ncbi:MAG: hypothetical protein ACFFDH_09465 [Promethearchaeota archaeon]